MKHANRLSQRRADRHAGLRDDFLCHWSAVTQSHGIRTTAHHPFRDTPYNSPWIRAAGQPSHAGYFRKRFDLPGPVRHAWLKIAATDAFEVSVNRNPAGRVYLWRPTRPFQTGTSEKGQMLSPQEPAMALNFPREYQWDGHDTWRLPTYIELTSALQPGKNVIAIEFESRLAPARVTFEGEISCGAARSFRFAATKHGWLNPRCRDHNCSIGRNSITGTNSGEPQSQLQGRSNHGRRSHPRGNLHRSHLSASGCDIRQQQRRSRTLSRPVVDRPAIDEAWLRLLTNRVYELFINGLACSRCLDQTARLGQRRLGVRSRFALDPATKPELLDPDEVGSNFVGKRFESPRNAAPDWMSSFIPSRRRSRRFATNERTIARRMAVSSSPSEHWPNRGEHPKRPICIRSVRGRMR